MVVSLKAVKVFARFSELCLTCDFTICIRLSNLCWALLGLHEFMHTMRCASANAVHQARSTSGAWIPVLVFIVIATMGVFIWIRNGI